MPGLVDHFTASSAAVEDAKQKGSADKKAVDMAVEKKDTQTAQASASDSEKVPAGAGKAAEQSSIPGGPSPVHDPLPAHLLAPAVAAPAHLPTATINQAPAPSPLAFASPFPSS